MKLTKSILDPTFIYVPSHLTSVTATWLRFGWRPKESADPQYLPAHPDADRVLNRKPAASAPCDHKWDCSCTTENAPRLKKQADAAKQKSQAA